MSPRRRPALSLAVLMAVVLLIGAAAWLFRDATQRTGAAQSGEDAVRAAADSIPAILSYQPATAQATLEAAARDRLAGKFLDDYTQLIKTVVIPDAVGKKISAEAAVPAAGVVSSDERHAVVIAYIDQTMTVGPAAPTKTTSTVRVTMDNVGGRWLISGFEQI